MELIGPELSACNGATEAARSVAVSNVSGPSSAKWSMLRPESTRPDKRLSGDCLLVELRSVIAATRCAVAVQQVRYRAEHSGLGQTPHRVPVGIHQGDNIVDDNDIFGDGVNVAARLEGLAEPGTAYRRGRADL
jgi:class 3 adenylate cyclase